MNHRYFQTENERTTNTPEQRYNLDVSATVCCNFHLFFYSQEESEAD